MDKCYKLHGYPNNKQGGRGFVCSHVSSSVAFNVWHKRLGHMSCNKMQFVPDLGLTHGEMKGFVCEICPKAK